VLNRAKRKDFFIFVCFSCSNVLLEVVPPWFNHSLTTKLARLHLNSKFYGLMLLKFYDPVDYLLHFVCVKSNFTCSSCRCKGKAGMFLTIVKAI
jgi:hypothetical protein